MNNNEQVLLMDLIHNQQLYKKSVESLLNQLKGLLETEDPILHNNIKKQFKDKVKSEFLQQAVKRLQITAEEALIVIESLNIEEYLAI
jgi:hypothetical protein